MGNDHPVRRDRDCTGSGISTSSAFMCTVRVFRVVRHSYCSPVLIPPHPPRFTNINAGVVNGYEQGSIKFAGFFRAAAQGI